MHVWLEIFDPSQTSDPSIAPSPQTEFTVIETVLLGFPALAEVAETLITYEPTEFADTVHVFVHDVPTSGEPHSCGFVLDVDRPEGKTAFIEAPLHFPEAPEQDTVALSVNVTPLLKADPAEGDVIDGVDKTWAEATCIEARKTTRTIKNIIFSIFPHLQFSTDLYFIFQRPHQSCQTSLFQLSS